MYPLFNYILPVFNKEDILPLTLAGIDKCAGERSRIFAIIDGCTDKSEQVVDAFAKKSGRQIEKIHMPNVHMLRSVNAGLRQVTEGFSIIMQDDIVLEDTEIERKLENLYTKMGPRLGVVSFRLASNVRKNSFYNSLRSKTLNAMIEECDFIQGPDDNQNYQVGEYESFYPRISAINGPNCIPWTVLSKVGLFDEHLAPYGYDDPEYCLRAINNGFINGLYPMKYKSDIEWGGTRRNKKFRKEAFLIHKRNRQYVWKKHNGIISLLENNPRLKASVKVEKLDFELI